MGRQYIHAYIYTYIHTGLWWGNLKDRDDLSHTWEDNIKLDPK